MRIKLHKLEDRKLHRKWVEALRSGEFKQGEGQLLCNDRYCCLGVLASVCGMPKDTIRRHGNLTDISRDDLLGTWTKNPDDPDYDSGDQLTLNTTQRKLAAMNDIGRTFKQIAAYIERYL